MQVNFNYGAWTKTDGFGRAKESWKKDNGGDVKVDTVYDGLGRAKKASNPYRPGLSEPVLWTESVFDAAGRVTSVVTPDGASVATQYAGNAITVTDQAGKLRRSITNGIGQLVRVDEPNDTGSLGTAASPNQATSYSYDALNNLIQVNQGAQTRTFAYDSLSRLRQAVNPESGTIAYSYDASGNLIQKTDARSVVTNYVYDNFNRVTQRSYSDATPQVTYTYEDASVNYSKGRLTKVSSSVSETRYTAIIWAKFSRRSRRRAGRITASLTATICLEC